MKPILRYRPIEVVFSSCLVTLFFECQEPMPAVDPESVKDPYSFDTGCKGCGTMQFLGNCYDLEEIDADSLYIDPKSFFYKEEKLGNDTWYVVPSRKN